MAAPSILELRALLKRSTLIFTSSSFLLKLLRMNLESNSPLEMTLTLCLLSCAHQSRSMVMSNTSLNMPTFSTTQWLMHRKQSKDATTRTSSDPQSQSELRCGFLRKKKNRRESARKTDKPSKLSPHSWVCPPTINTKVVTAIKIMETRVDISSATLIIVITTREVGTVVAEVEEVATETTLKEIRANRLNNSLKPFFLYLRLVLPSLRKLRHLMIENNSLAISSILLLLNSSLRMLVVSPVCSLMKSSLTLKTYSPISNTSAPRLERLSNC